ncbi:TMV resistance protein N-like [Rutidosis leptorrhynchoides]|uniref:TMV resistance protein N-like n=1 Tax=Rutidosis leptorrhynchoides TaxID=125765 RepID=UPI003A9A5973
MALTNILEKQSSTDNHAEKYDVFLSFRGFDTRFNFTNHLHQALERANLKTFLDKDVIPTGRYLKPELENAIKSSTASVIVLSKNYASSTWCLDELVLILDRHKNFKQIVIPIFYHVEPTDVRKQQDSFGGAMAAHRKKMEAETDEDKKRVLAEKIEIWKEALTKVSNLTGLDVNGRLETEFIKEIVKELSKRIRVPVRTTLPLLIGKEDAIENVSSWLKDGSSNTVDILSIYGMGGIGKSTLAKYIYDSYCREFDTSSIVEDISRKCDGNVNGLLDLKNQLCNDISKASSIQVHDVSVASNKVLIVLDDIDSIDQLDALLGNKSFHEGSKIIITTRDMSLTDRCELCKTKAECRHTKYPLEHLSDEASLELLCLHAFNGEDLKDGYEEVLEDILEYCEGHPLALKVLGKNLYNRDLSYWEGCIKELKKGLDGHVSRVNKILKMSFESLESKNDKELFKYIACLFVGIDRALTEMVLHACNLNTSTGIEHLIDRCLLRTGRNGVFEMHSLIQEMGRYVVDLESENPGERSLLWRTEDSLEVLTKKTGTRNIKALNVLECGSLLELETDAFSNMDNLKILELEDVLLKGSYENFPKELIFLSMDVFPSELQMKKLVALDLSYSNIKCFDVSTNNMLPPGNKQKVSESYSKDNRLLGCLKILDLRHSYQLHTLGGFCELPALEMLILIKCTSLVEVCETIEKCHQLVYINFSDCNKCRKLLTNIDILKHVKTLYLDGCNMSELPFESSKKVNNNLIDLKLQPSSSATVEAIIPRDNLSSNNLSYFSSSLVTLSLSSNNLTCVDFPIDWSCLSWLTYLRLDGNPIVSMPSCVRTLPNLESLYMEKCDMLTSIEHPPPTLRLLVYTHSNSNTNLLHKMSFHPEMSQLQLHMDLYPLARSSIEIEGVVKIQPMAGVEEAVLHNLGWRNLEFTKTRRVGTYNKDTGEPEGSQTQMYYEFGIFSTVYGGEQMPDWIGDVSNGGSISLIIPSSPKQLRGLNFCCVEMHQSSRASASNQMRGNRLHLPIIEIFNITKDTKLSYNHCIEEEEVNAGRDECVTYISHWMFTVREMEPGDHVTVSTLKDTDDEQRTRECGVSFVYDDCNINEEEEEEDVLGYYKSWNHIIGGDLSPFLTTFGDYFLSHWYFGRSSRHYYLVKEHEPFFRAFSQKKSNKLVRAIEDVTDTAQGGVNSKVNCGINNQRPKRLKIQPKWTSDYQLNDTAFFKAFSQNKSNKPVRAVEVEIGLFRLLIEVHHVLRRGSERHRRGPSRRPF